MLVETYLFPIVNHLIICSLGYGILLTLLHFYEKIASITRIYLTTFILYLIKDWTNTYGKAFTDKIVSGKTNIHYSLLWLLNINTILAVQFFRINEWINTCCFYIDLHVLYKLSKTLQAINLNQNLKFSNKGITKINLIH